jgi:hypothetical protein
VSTPQKTKERDAEMKKVINPIKKTDGERSYHVFIKIELKDGGRLSISGVEGPMSNGNCLGGCGQIDMHLRTEDRHANGWEYTTGWDAEMMNRLLEVWERWHLNDMRAECVHQRANGWREKAAEKVTLYHWRMTREASEAQKAAEKAAINALKDGKTFTPTQEQSFIAALPYAQTTYTAELPAKIAGYYEPKKPLYAGDGGHTEIKTLGWVRQDEHPDGILSRPCPVCDYKYGTKWLKEEVPQDVIDWLLSLPTSEVKPVWV